MLRLTLASLLALSIPLSAQAQGPTQGQAPSDHDYSQMAKDLIVKFDTNKDGKVSMEEFTAPGQEQFKGIDKNGDGSLTEDETKGAIEEEVQARMKQMEEMQKMQPPAEKAPAEEAPTEPAK
jgi:hypothetical protein